MNTSSDRVKTPAEGCTGSALGVGGHSLDDDRIALFGESRLPGEIDEMPGAVGFGLEVEAVVGVRWNDEGDAAADLQSVLRKLPDLRGVVRHQPDRSDREAL